MRGASGAGCGGPGAGGSGERRALSAGPCGERGGGSVPRVTAPAPAVVRLPPALRVSGRAGRAALAGVAGRVPERGGERDRRGSASPRDPPGKGRSARAGNRGVSVLRGWRRAAAGREQCGPGGGTGPGYSSPPVGTCRTVSGNGN